MKIVDIKLPKFQRPFVWKKNDITKLLDSIYKGYPIGTILLWLTKSTKLANDRKIDVLEIDYRPDEFPAYYLLDGQQRLFTLCRALYWNGNNINSQWNIGFDLDKEQFFFKNIKKDWFVPSSIFDMTFDNYQDFIAEYRVLIAKKIREYYGTI